MATSLRADASLNSAVVRLVAYVALEIEVLKWEKVARVFNIISNS